MYSTHASFPRCPASFPATIFRPQYLFLHICNKAKTPTSICATNPMDVEWLDEVHCNMASLFWTWIASMMLQMWDDCNLNVINVYFFYFLASFFVVTPSWNWDQWINTFIKNNKIQQKEKNWPRYWIEFPTAPRCLLCRWPLTCNARQVALACLHYKLIDSYSKTQSLKMQPLVVIDHTSGMARNPTSDLRRSSEKCCSMKNESLNSASTQKHEKTSM